MTPPDTTVPAPRSWWAEPELLWLVGLVLLAYFVRLDVLALRGEESRRAHLGAEMLRTGEWIVPQQQGEPVFFRPPLQNWMIAGLALLTGECDVWAARLPSALATLLMTLLLYGYSRNFLSRLGAFSAAAAYATMAEVLQFGTQAETDAVFTFFISGSLLVWHWGYTRGWSPAWMWSLSYLLAALGTLTKGPQAPIYFVASVGVYLISVGQWRRLFTLSHLLGVAVFTLIFGAWAVPYYLKMDWHSLRLIIGDEASVRFLLPHWTHVVEHLILFPLEIAGCLLPWALVLPAYSFSSFRQRLGEASPAVRFLWTCILVTFPSCWFALAARSRYYLPMYPCFAPLIGAVVQHYLQAQDGSLLRRGWTWFVSACGLAFLTVAALAVAGGEVERLTGFQWAQPPLTAAGLALALTALAVVLFRTRRQFEPGRMKLAVLCLACGLALAYSFWYVNILLNRQVHAPEAIARLKEELHGERLVSFSKVHHLFSFYYQEHIPIVPLPKAEAELPDDFTYFCFDAGVTEPSLPFPWERVAVINCDRNVRAVPLDTVVVGRLLPAGQPGAPDD